MAGVLTDFLRDSAARPWVWGECDCLLWLADWVQVRTGQDPAASWRGRYRTRIGAARLINCAGGLVQLVGQACAPLGLVRTETPAAGDIAIVATALGQGGAIRGDRGWLCKSREGVAMTQAAMIAAWTIDG